MDRKIVVLLFAVLLLVVCVWAQTPKLGYSLGPDYWVVTDTPVRHKNVVVYPVFANRQYPLTLSYLTLQEAVESKQVEITEMQPGLIRDGSDAVHGATDQFRLMLVNKSDRPLLLLAGEVLVGGKQDRVISEDRIVPPKADPISISVLCAEHDRSTGNTISFTNATSGDRSMSFNTSGALLTAPSVRAEAVSKDQAGTWASIGSVNSSALTAVDTGMMYRPNGSIVTVPRTVVGPTTDGHPNEITAMGATSGTPSFGIIGNSYVMMERSQETKKALDAESAEIRTEFERVLSSLALQADVVGVVFAVGDRVVSADVFATPGLFQKYWPKLVRSYAVEATRYRTPDDAAGPSLQKVRGFLALTARHYMVDVEPYEYELQRVEKDGVTATLLRSLLEVAGPTIHYSKLTRAERITWQAPQPGMIIVPAR